MKVKMTQLRAWTLAAACGAALLATGCQTANGGKGDEAALPAATAAKTSTATTAKDCSKPVVAQSSHAVGDPCLTTADIAKSLGVSPKQVAKHTKKHHKKKTAHH